MTELTVLGDWGSTRLRLWLREGNDITDKRYGPGIIGLERPATEILVSALADFSSGRRLDRVVLCGMAGAREGVAEAPYAPCPVAIPAWKAQASRLVLDDIDLRIAAGCAYQNVQGRCDVMRGEETQVFGALGLHPDMAEGIWTIVLPGTHSKWVRLEDGRITAFRTFLTGELFARLQGSSLLPTPINHDAPLDEEAFAEGAAAAGRRDGLLGGLFTARAARMLRAKSEAWSQDYLSGLLIASELSESIDAGTSLDRVAIVGAAGLTRRYLHALSAFDCHPRELDGERCVLKGLQTLDEEG